MNVNEKMLAGNADVNTYTCTSYPNADPDAT